METIKSAVALDWDHNTNSIFWTDVDKDTINHAYLNGSQQRVIVGSNLSKIKMNFAYKSEKASCNIVGSSLLAPKKK